MIKNTAKGCPAPAESSQLKVEDERGRIKRKGRKTMPRKTYKPEEIVGILRDAGIKQGQGQSVANICREKGISEAIYYRWKKEYGGMHPSEAKQLKELEKENNRLKKLLAEVMLDNQILKDINSGNI